MELNYAKLQKYLYELVEIKGIKPAEITRESKVWNIKKMIEGKCEPTMTSWDKLHKTYPSDIPPPEYTNGSSVFIAADHQSQAAGRSVFNMAPQGVSLSASEQALIDGLRKLGEKKDEFIYEVLGMISKMLKNQ
jgi:hypothetical protein